MPDSTLQPQSLIVVTAPTIRPVTAANVSEHLRLVINVDAGENQINAMIDAATAYAEDDCDMSVMQQTLRATFHDGQPLNLPRGPVQSVTRMIDGRGVESTAFTLRAVGHTCTVIPSAALSYPISVEYVAGYASAEVVPAQMRLAILQHVGTLWANRESATDRNKTIVPHSLEMFYSRRRRSVGLR